VMIPLHTQLPMNSHSDMKSINKPSTIVDNSCDYRKNKLTLDIRKVKTELKEIA
jgi:hypothetical protein